MSIASEITRLQQAKADIKTAIEAKGVTVDVSAKLDTYSDYIAQIPQGGGEYEPICFTSLEDGNTFSLNKEISISVDNKQTWQTLSANANSPVINTGEKIYFKATDNAVAFAGNTSSDYYQFTTAKTCNVSGHPYSLYAKGSYYFFANLFRNTKIVDASGLDLSEDIKTPYCYRYMFSGCTSLTTAPELPSVTLAPYCYDSMFYNCTNLITAPQELPAMTLADYCYSSMFQGCTNLVTAPELPAMTLTIECYRDMFNSCTNLITAPELPAETLKYQCYSGMFSECTNLNYIKALFTTTPGYPTGNWVYGVAATGTFVKNSAATWSVTGVDGIPTGWTVETAS